MLKEWQTLVESSVINDMELVNLAQKWWNMCNIFRSIISGTTIQFLPSSWTTLFLVCFDCHLLFDFWNERTQLECSINKYANSWERTLTCLQCLCLTTERSRSSWPSQWRPWYPMNATSTMFSCNPQIFLIWFLAIHPCGAAPQEDANVHFLVFRSIFYNHLDPSHKDLPCVVRRHSFEATHGRRS